jgi:hypothetical protein
MSMAREQDLAWIWLFGAVVVLIAAGLGLGGDTIGVILLLGALLAAVGTSELRRDRRLSWVFLGVIAAHAAVALINGLVSTTLGADRDANSFHLDASQVAAASEVDSDMVIAYSPYGRALGFVYYYLGTSHVLGNALSVLATSLSCVVLVKLMRELGIGRRGFALAVFGLMPSGIMLLSVTLREAYQQLFLLIAVLATLRMRSRGPHWALVLLPAALALPLLHDGLIMFAGLLVVSGFAWGAGRGRGRAPQRLVVLALVSAMVVLAMTRTSGLARSLDAVQNGQAFEYADNYRTRGEANDARTTYSVHLDPSSPLAFTASLPFVFVEYMFAPFPWQVGNLLDVEALLESGLRLILLIASVATWRRARGEQRSQLGYLLWTYFGMELLWSLGTFNWGTSIRHHLPVLGLLAVAGGPLFAEKLAATVRRTAEMQRAS